MGLAIIMAIAWAIVLSSLMWVRKWWTYLICFVVGIGGLFGLMAFVLFDPFATPMTTELSETVNLTVISEEDILVKKDKDWQLTDDNIKIEVVYKLSDLPDECLYLFVDENTRLYYVEEDSIKVAKFNSSGILDTESMRSGAVEIIKGDYESIYAEKYVTKSKVTFWSLGIYSEIEYKIYIPEDMITE